VSLGFGGAGFGIVTKNETSASARAGLGSAFKLWVPFRLIVTRKESPRVAEVAKEIGILPRSGSGKTTAAEHALGEKLSDSPYVSASERRAGAPGFEGETVRIDVKEAVRTGSEYISHGELKEKVAEHGAAHPEKLPRVEKWRAAQLGPTGERESLLKGPVDPSAIESKALRGARGLAKGFGVAGAALSGYRIATAASEDRVQVVAEEAAGWAGAIAGAEVGAHLGRGAGLWGTFVGGLAGGVLGAFGATSYVSALFDLMKEPPPPENGIIGDQPAALFRHAA